MFQRLRLPLFPAKYISQDYIFYSWSYFALVFLWQGPVIFLAVWAMQQHLCVALGHAVSVADRSGADPGRAPGHVTGGQPCLLVHSCWDGTGLRWLCRAEMFRLPPAPRANRVPRDVALTTKHFHCTFTAHKAATCKRLKVGGSVSSILFLSFFFSLSLWSWLNLLIPCCGLRTPTFPLMNTHFQWGGGAEFTSMTQGTLKYN